MSDMVGIKGNGPLEILNGVAGMVACDLSDWGWVGNPGGSVWLSLNANYGGRGVLHFCAADFTGVFLMLVDVL